MAHITSTRGFKVEDVTFKHARRQNEIEKELNYETVAETEVEVPVSLTPEQVIDYYQTLINLSDDTKEKVLFSQTIKWIKELQKVKAELVVYKLRKEREEEASFKTPDDIQ